MVTRKHMEPAFKILYLVHFEFDDQFFENLHYSILALLFIFEVVEANPENQVHVFVVKRTQCI